MARASEADNDRAFVEKMGQANIAEVKLGQLAAERASNAQVKQFAGRMVNDHQKANGELKQIASKMAVQLPADLDAKHQELYDRLSKLKGPEFDREYMKAMVDGHQEVLRELERQRPAARRTRRRHGWRREPGECVSERVGEEDAARRPPAPRAGEAD